MPTAGSHVVQLLLPLRDNDGAPFEAAVFTRIRTALTERFGGVTAYSRAPAQGAWKEDSGGVVRDDVVIYEVVVDTLDEEWWRAYGAELRRIFRQEEMMIRAVPCLRL